MRSINTPLRPTFGMTLKSKKEKNLCADIDILPSSSIQKCIFLAGLILNKLDLMIFSLMTSRNDFGKKKFAQERNQKREHFIEQLLLET